MYFSQWIIYIQSQSLHKRTFLSLNTEVMKSTTITLMKSPQSIHCDTYLVHNNHVEIMEVAVSTINVPLVLTTITIFSCHCDQIHCIRLAMLSADTYNVHVFFLLHRNVFIIIVCTLVTYLSHNGCTVHTSNLFHFTMLVLSPILHVWQLSKLILMNTICLWLQFSIVARSIGTLICQYGLECQSSVYKTG